MRSCSVFVLILAGLAAATAPAAQPQAPQRIEITASRFTFTPGEITLKKGQPVVLVLRSADVTHGLKIPELHVKCEIKKGKTVEVPLTPETAGHFVGKCSHFCGRGHGRMKLQVTVVE